MKIKVIGKAHRQGTSKKTGKDYDFIQLHFVAPDRGVEGYAAQTITLEPGQFDYGSIQVDGVYNVEYGPRGYVVGLEWVDK